MGQVVGDGPCPACQEMGHDKTGNHLLEFADGGRYCGKVEYHKNGKPYRENADGLCEEDEVMGKINFEDVATLPFMEIADRKLKLENCEHFGIRVSLNTADRTQVDEHFYPYTKGGKIVGYKVRGQGKKFFSLGNLKGAVEFFGQSVTKLGGKKLLVTEGELDAVSCYQMLLDKYPGYPPNVVSLPKGATNALQCFVDNEAFVNSFKEVLLYFDQDKPGQDATRDVVGLLGDKAKIVRTSKKDGSEMLTEGLQGEFINAFFRAESYKPTGLVRVADVADKAKEMPTWGRPFPWPTLTKKTYGRRLGEGYYIGAGVKIGKSEWLNQLIAHILATENTPVLLIKLEETPDFTTKKVAGKIHNKQFHKPDGDFTQEELDAAIEALKASDRLLMYEQYGATTWEDIKPLIRYACMVEGVRDVFIDPITKITGDLDDKEINTELRMFADEISTMSKNLGFTYYNFCHLNAPKTGLPHEHGGRVFSYQFTGSRAMQRCTYYSIGLERDKYHEDPIQRNTTNCVLLDDRMFGQYVQFPIYYDEETGSYLEPAEKPLNEIEEQY